LQLSAANTGNAHAQVLKWELSSSERSQVLAQNSGGYVLPGTSHTWDVKLVSPLAANTPLTISADTDRGTLHAQLVLGK
jgi:P pilus assembly chaperone PapD